MAFTVTPTSGTGPYVFTAVFSAKNSLFTDKYDIEVYPRTQAGTCPVPATFGTRATNAEASLLATDSYSTTVNVQSGSCLVSTVVIRELATGTVVSQASAQVSNIV